MRGLIFFLMMVFGNSAYAAPKKVLIVVTSHDQLGSTSRKTGYYLSEVVHPYFQLISAGLNVDLASPNGGNAPMDETSRNLKDPEIQKFLGDPSLVKKLENTLKLENVDAGKYSAVVFAGGHGAMWDFPDNQVVSNFTAKIYDQGGIVSAVCHGPAALVDVKLSDGKYLVAGKKVATFTNAEEEQAGQTKVVPFLLQDRLTERGAKVITAPNWSENVIVDGRLITGQNPKSASALGKAVAKALK